MAMPEGISSAITTEEDPGYKWRVLASVVVGLFMVILDATVVNVALKTIQLNFHVTTDQAQWTISLYTLALGITTPISGFLGDRFGNKRIYLSGITLFVTGSILAGIFSRTDYLLLLIIARGVQGIGGGIALPLGTALLFSAFPPKQRGAAFGIFGIVLVFAPAIGPLLGGWLVDHNQLPWIFFLNLPVGIVGLTIGLRFLHTSPRARHAHIDIPGIIFSALGFGAILFAASLAGEQSVGWSDIRVIASLIVGIASLVVFVFVEWRTPEPLLDLHLYTIPSFALANIASTVGIIALFGAEFLLPLYLQILRGESAFQTGLILLPLAIASAITSVVAGRISDRIGPRVPIVIGFLLIAYNTYQLSQITLTTSIVFIMFLVAIRGFGIGLIIQNSQLAALMDVPLSKLNRGTPLVQATRQTMQSIGIAVLATILSGAVTVSVTGAIADGNVPNFAALPPAQRALAEQGLHLFQNQYIVGFEHAYLATCIIAIIATFVSLFLPGWPQKYAPKAQYSASPPAVKEVSEISSPLSS